MAMNFKCALIVAANQAEFSSPFSTFLYSDFTPFPLSSNLQFLSILTLTS